MRSTIQILSRLGMAPHIKLFSTLNLQPTRNRFHELAYLPSRTLTCTPSMKALPRFDLNNQGFVNYTTLTKPIRDRNLDCSRAKLANLPFGIGAEYLGDLH